MDLTKLSGIEKKRHKVRVELSNPGTLEFEATAIKCENGNYCFLEEDAEAVFEAFETAIKNKKTK